MTMPATIADETHDGPLADTPEIFGVDLPLEDGAGAGFDAAIAEAGASLLFSVQIADGAAERQVAAVIVGTGASRRFLIVTQPQDGPASVEAAESSHSPLAPLARSYAAVLERWPVAAA